MRCYGKRIRLQVAYTDLLASLRASELRSPPPLLLYLGFAMYRSLPRPVVYADQNSELHFHVAFL